MKSPSVTAVWSSSLMPAGFFYSSVGQGRTQPNALIWLVSAGALSLAPGAVTLGIGLLTS